MVLWVEERRPSIGCLLTIADVWAKVEVGIHTIACVINIGYIYIPFMSPVVRWRA